MDRRNRRTPLTVDQRSSIGGTLTSWPGTPGVRESLVERDEDSRMVVVMPPPSLETRQPGTLLQMHDD